MTQIEQIRAEIKRLKSCKLNLEEDTEYLRGYDFAIDTIEEFINSLPAEQSTEQLCWNDMTEEEKSDFFFDLSHQKQIEQSSKELAEAAQNHAREMYGENWMELEQTQDSGFKAISNFKFGAQWQKEKLIKKAHLWLQHNAEKYVASYGFPCYQIGLLLNEFTHAMEDN